VVAIGGITVAGELLLPTAGAAGFVERAAVLSAIPLALLATGFFGPAERARMRQLLQRPTAAR